jgi:ornithine cyclodeaminase/alanine dehydrogenase-like protein (mu-crystallin family)
MTLLLTEENIKKIIFSSPKAIPEIVDLVERAFRDLAKGHMTLHPRVHVSYPPYQEGDGYASYERAMRFLPAILPGFEAAGFRFYSTFSPDGKGWTEQTEWIALLDYKDMTLQAFLSDHYIHEFRTSAPSGVAVRHLARSRHNQLGLFGTGRQAKGVLRTLCSEMKPKAVKVYGRNEQNRIQFAKEMEMELGIEIMPVSSPKQVVEEVDVVTAATKTEVPVLDGDWLEPGTTVISLARKELDEKTVLGANRIITGSVQQTLYDTPPRQPFAGLVEKGRISKERFEPFAEVVSGERPGRINDEELIVFVSPGMAMLDVAIASWLYKLARQMEIGQEIEI